MNEPGDHALALIEDVLEKEIDHLVLIMRHSAREFAPDKHDLLNPLTDEGRHLAIAFGERLPKTLTLRGYSSPAERCVETAELILKGHADAGGTVTRTRPAEALGVFYVLDQMKMFKSMQAAGGQLPMLERWFRGDAKEDVMIPAGLAAQFVARFAARKLDSKVARPQLDVLVSHDMTLYTIKAMLLRQPASQYGEVGFLDGVVIYRQDNKYYIHSHHDMPVTLDLSADSQ